MNRFRIVSLVVALLVAQFSWASHVHSIDEHHAETECFLCIHISFLDNAIPGNNLVINKLSSHTYSDRTAEQSSQFTHLSFFNSRAPPR